MPASEANPLTFPLSSAEFDESVFRNPPAAYRGAPLWCWNTKLRGDRLLRQIDQLAEMGMGGFHIHSRVGLDTQYMGPEFMDLVKSCVDRAKEKQMMACLYDEDRWPSGAAGGLVMKGHPEFRGQHLLFTPWSYGNSPNPIISTGRANGSGARSELGFLVGRYEIELQAGKLQSFRRLKESEDSTETTWYAYVEPNRPSEWFNGETYVDALNPKAISRFIETTHEVYYQKLSKDFGTTVPCIFTDEPQFAFKTTLKKSLDKTDIILPWTLDIEESFRAQYGYELLDMIPQLVWDSDDANSRVTRFNFHDHVCERFVTSFMDTMALWTQKHGIALIGHMMKEPTLLSQTQALGEAMRCYRNLDMPGVDMLCDHMEYNTVKQASSVARQNGTRGVMSEIYGVTNWTFDFRGHKASGDWQAALGVVFRVHHLSWVSMAGEAKRDYPAAIGYQSPWYKEYSYIEDYFARVGTCITRGHAVTRVAVVHPIESYWLSFGPKETSGEEQAFRNEAFEDLTKWLLHGLIDFDFISESLFPNQTPLDSIVSGSPLTVGKCEYDVVIVPNFKTIRSSTLERLQKFASVGGKVILAGSEPTLVDARPVGGKVSIPGSEKVEWSSYHILEALKPWREISIVSTDEGEVPAKMLYHLRDDGEDRYIFICNADRWRWYPTEVKIRGNWDITILDAFTGDDWKLKTKFEKGWTTFEWLFETCSNILARLSPVSVVSASSQLGLDQFVERTSLRTAGLTVLKNIELSEPNVLVLDYATFKVDDGAWQNTEEVLRIDNIVRRQLKLPQKLEALRQPWSVPPEARGTDAILTLRFEIESSIDVPSSKLALENASTTGIILNGIEVPSTPIGWWVDEDIGTVVLPPLKKGLNILELTYKFNRLTNIERVYLLGDFEVEIRGTKCKILPQDLSRLNFGDWSTQGYPFYAGNMTYHCTFTPPNDTEVCRVEVPRFMGPVVTVDLEGVRMGTIAIDPHVVELGVLENREYTVSVTCYGNRENSFGTLHLPNGCTKWFAPNAWRSEHDWWMEGYNVKPMGLPQAPKIKVPGKEIYHVFRNPEKTWI